MRTGTPHPTLTLDRILRAAARMAIVALTLVPILCGGELGLPALYFPAVTAKHVGWLALLAMASGCCLALTRWRGAALGSPLGWLAVVGVALAAVAAALGADATQSWTGSFERLDGVLLTASGAAYFLVARAVMDATWWRRWLWASVAVACVLAAVALLQSAQVLLGVALPAWIADPSVPPPTEARFFRATGRFGSGVFAASYWALHSAMLMTAGARQTGRRRLALLALAALTGAAVLASQTRITAAALCAVAGWLGIRTARAGTLSPRGRRLLIATMAAAAFAIAIPLVALAIDPVRFEQWPGLSRAVSAIHELGRRGLLFGVALQGLADAPWTGVGPANFELVWDRHFEPRLWTTAERFDHPHNAALAWAAAAGLPGLVWVALFAAALWRAVRRHPDPVPRAALTAALLVYAAHAALQPTALWDHIALWSIAAFVDRRGRPPDPAVHASRPAAGSARLALAVAIAAGLGAIPLALARDAQRLGALAQLRAAPAIAESAPRHADAHWQQAAGTRTAREAFHEIGVLALRAASDLEIADTTALPLAQLVQRAADALHAERPARVHELLLAANVAIQTAARVRRDRERSQSHLERARALLERALERSPRRASLHEAMALVHLGTPGERRQAMAAARTAHEVAAGNHRSALHAIAIALGLRRFELAQELAAPLYPVDGALHRWPSDRLLQASRTAERPLFWLPRLRPRVDALRGLVDRGAVAPEEARRRVVGMAELLVAGGRREDAVRAVRAFVTWDPDFATEAERRIATW